MAWSNLELSSRNLLINAKESSGSNSQALSLLN